MRIYPTGNQAQYIDSYTQNEIGILGIVLMEKAAERLAWNIHRKLVADRDGDGISAGADGSRFSGGADGSSIPVGAKTASVLAVAEGGNNGGDAVAAARILKTMGYRVSVFEIGGIKRKTDSYLKQVEIAKNLGVEFIDIDTEKSGADDYAGIFAKYGVIIDGVFGVGLSREVAGVQKTVIEGINRSGVFVVGCDIPSGISADSGHILGAAVKCDMTVTFQYVKYGMLFGEGRAYSGEIICEDIGLYRAEDADSAGNSDEAGDGSSGAEGAGNSDEAGDGSSGADSVGNSDVAGAGSSGADGAGFKMPGDYVYYENDDEEIRSFLPARVADANKGTYGKVLIVAGSKDIYGALYLSATACCKAGAGLVKVVTDVRNRDLLMDKLPEAMMLTYETEMIEGEYFAIGENKAAGGESVVEEAGNKAGSGENRNEEPDGKAEAFSRFRRDYIQAVNWADVILIGPGLGNNAFAEGLLRDVAENAKPGQSIVLDADALNIIAAGDTKAWFEKFNKNPEGGSVIITPHMAEMSRLAGQLFLREKNGNSKSGGSRISMDELKDNRAEIASVFADEMKVICILKDARTVIAAPSEKCGGRKIYVNTTGNCGMSKGGSGDVLAGLLAGLLARNREGRHGNYETACAAVHLHGKAGDAARDTLGEGQMLAGDIISYFKV